jgi:hypothetical protein
MQTVSTVKVTARCTEIIKAGFREPEECGGAMEPTGFRYDTCPPMYPHKCVKCGHGENLDKVYPAIEYL